MEFADPVPSDEALDAYNAEYFKNAHGGVSDNPITIAFHSGINLLRVQYVESFLADRALAVDAVLEIGPGMGYFARHWKERNPSTQLYAGVEADHSCYPVLKESGLQLYDTPEEVPADRRFQLVVISHVLEHTSDPAAFIQGCTRLLAPGGLLFVEVPCLDYRYKATVEPHLLFFDREPMRRFISRLGFEVGKVSYHGNLVTDLQKAGTLYRGLYNKARNFLLARGFHFPFSGVEKGLEKIKRPLERAAVKPFKPHIEQQQPAWWIRMIAVKK